MHPGKRLVSCLGAWTQWTALKNRRIFRSPAAWQSASSMILHQKVARYQRVFSSVVTMLIQQCWTWSTSNVLQSTCVHVVQFTWCRTYYRTRGRTRCSEPLNAYRPLISNHLQPKFSVFTEHCSALFSILRRLKIARLRSQTQNSNISN